MPVPIPHDTCDSDESPQDQARAEHRVGKRPTPGDRRHQSGSRTLFLDIPAYLPKVRVSAGAVFVSEDGGDYQRRGSSSRESCAAGAGRSGRIAVPVADHYRPTATAGRRGLPEVPLSWRATAGAAWRGPWAKRPTRPQGGATPRPSKDKPAPAGWESGSPPRLPAPLRGLDPIAAGRDTNPRQPLP